MSLLAEKLADAGMSTRQLLVGNVNVCRVCGCDDDRACIVDGVPCHWVVLDIDTPTGIYSACAVKVGWQRFLFSFVAAQDQAA